MMHGQQNIKILIHITIFFGITINVISQLNKKNNSYNSWNIHNGEKLAKDVSVLFFVEQTFKFIPKTQDAWFMS
jgi:hypothetical protein